MSAGKGNCRVMRLRHLYTSVDNRFCDFYIISGYASTSYRLSIIFFHCLPRFISMAILRFLSMSPLNIRQSPFIVVLSFFLLNLFAMSVITNELTKPPAMAIVSPVTLLDKKGDTRDGT